MTMVGALALTGALLAFVVPACGKDGAPSIQATFATRAPSQSGPPALAEAPKDGALLTSERASVPASGPKLRRSWLSDAQIVSYYGHPGGDSLGVLGEGSPEEITARLKRQAASYAEAQPGVKVIPAFHIIAAVAQGRPQADGTYVIRMSDEELQPYLKIARDNGFLVFLDLQIGRSTVEAEVERVRRYLADPSVHLALDPEFAMPPGEVPGSAIGSLTGNDINAAQRILDAIVRENGLPNKILIVHEFREGMIKGKGVVSDYPDIDLVYDADGYGPPGGKLGLYQQLIATPFTRFSAIKLFYKHDTGLLTPAQVLGLEPKPSIIIYQ